MTFVALTGAQPSAARAQDQEPADALAASTSEGQAMATTSASAIESAPFQALDPAATLSATTPLQAIAPYRFDLWRSSAFSSQATIHWCVGASIQMMRNLVTGESRHSTAQQHSYWTLAQSYSHDTADGGADPYGWSVALGRSGAGHYRVVARSTRQAALKVLARAMARTGRPGGFVVRHGGHAMVVAGFAASADPLLSPDAQVTGVLVVDPLYPRLHTPSGKRVFSPDTLFSGSLLHDQFTGYHDWSGQNPELAGRFVVVVPTI
jgi:hypothetical protein